MTLPRYPEYRPIKESWLGEAPAGWAVVRLQQAASINDDTLSESTAPDFAMEYVDIGSVSLERGVERTEQFTFAGAPSRARRLVRDGDIVISTVRTYLKAIAPISNPPDNLVVSTGFAVVRPRQAVTPSFAKYVLQAPGFVDAVIARSTGVSYPAINASDLARIPIPLPAPGEQAAIATFLDRETAKIDALIAEQEKLIALLAEKRQATISHAVTRGLNPNAPMKDSGVPWLGEVPAHWSVSRLKHVTKLIVDCPHETPVYDEDGAYLVIRTADVSEGRLSTGAMYAVSGSEYESRIRRQALELDDIVYGREGERWGYAALVPGNDQFCLGQRMMQFRANNQTCSRFLMWQLNSSSTYRQGQIDTVGATSPHVNVGTIRNYALAIPPIDEQREISSFLDGEVQRLDALDLEAGRTVSLLKERRSALIAAAVTGQIDVRGLVAA